MNEEDTKIEGFLPLDRGAWVKIAGVWYRLEAIAEDESKEAEYYLLKSKGLA